MSGRTRYVLPDGTEVEVVAARRDGQLIGHVGARAVAWELLPGPRGALVVRDGDRVRTLWVHGDHVAGGRGGEAILRRAVRDHRRGGAAASGGLEAPMPGTVLEVRVRAGDAVSAGDTLLVMEAMKMEHAITAPRDGIVARVHFEVGGRVGPGDTLVELS